MSLDFTLILFLSHFTLLFGGPVSWLYLRDLLGGGDVKHSRNAFYGFHCNCYKLYNIMQLLRFWSLLQCYYVNIEEDILLVINYVFVLMQGSCCAYSLACRSDWRMLSYHIVGIQLSVHFWILSAHLHILSFYGFYISCTVASWQDTFYRLTHCFGRHVIGYGI
jgi:hypothetical protein